MAVTLDAISSGRNSTGDITVAHTISSGSNLILIAVSTVQDSNHASFPVVTIKWNGTDLTKVRHDEPVGNVRTEIWYLLNPDEGTFNCSVSQSPSVSPSASASASPSQSPIEYADKYNVTVNTYGDKYSTVGNTYMDKYTSTL